MILRILALQDARLLSWQGNPLDPGNRGALIVRFNVFLTKYERLSVPNQPDGDDRTKARFRHPRTGATIWLFLPTTTELFVIDLIP